MILVDTGPLVALFDANDQDHGVCRRLLDTLDEGLVTTIPVLTEAFHLLRPTRYRVSGLMDFVRNGGVGVLPLDGQSLRRCFELMMQYADLPMDFADASIVAAAEHSGTEKVFTLDRRDFTTYRITRGYHQVPFLIVGDASGPRLVREGAADADSDAACTTPSATPASANAEQPDL